MGQIDLGSRAASKMHTLATIIVIRITKPSLNPTCLSNRAICLVPLPRRLPRFKFLMELPSDCVCRNQGHKSKYNQVGKSRFHA